MAQPFDRRTFLDSLLAVGFVSTAAAIAYPVGWYLVPPESGEPDTASAVAAKAAELKPSSGKVFKFGNRPGIVVRTADGEVRAFSAVCTHVGCLVNKVTSGTIGCPCHGSEFKITNGAVVAGPAPSPLPARQIKIVDDQVILL